jgi:hypothetical protein
LTALLHPTKEADVTVLAALTGFCLALVLALGWAVVVLRRDVASLNAQLQEARDTPAGPTEAVQPASAADPAATVRDAPAEPRLAVRTVVSFDGRDDEQPTGADAGADAPAPPREAVPVITRMSEPIDDVDLTTRRVASVTLARPLIKVAALGHGVRRALDDEHRLRVRLTMKRELKRQRKMRRRRRADRAASQGWER